MSYCALINDNMEAQLRENTLESITSQTNELMSAQIGVGEIPQSIETNSATATEPEYVYVVNNGSDSL